CTRLLRSYYFDYW
nr:immunoglobulin heavy chain junction region [Mus musculus]